MARATSAGVRSSDGRWNRWAAARSGPSRAGSTRRGLATPEGQAAALLRGLAAPGGDASADARAEDGERGGDRAGPRAQAAELALDLWPHSALDQLAGCLGGGGQVGGRDG